MKNMSAALEAEQKKPLRRPLIEVSCRRYGHPAKAGGSGGTAKTGIQWSMFGWELLHSDTTAPACHGVTIPEDGSLNRIALSGSTVLHQRVAAPGPGSNFAISWNTILNSNLAGVCAIASRGPEIMVFSPVNDGGYFSQYVRSTDNGESFGSPVTVNGSNPPIHAAAACCANNGNWGLISAASASGGLCFDILRHSDRVLLTHSLHPDNPSVYGLAMYFDGDWNIVVLEQSGNSLFLKRYVFGAGYRVASSTWTAAEALDLGRARIDQPSLLTRYLERQEPYSDFATLADEYEYYTMFRGKTYPAADLRALQAEQRHQVYNPSHWDTVSSILTARATDNLDVDAPFICSTGGGAVLSLYKGQERWFFRLRPGTDFYDSDWDRADKQCGTCIHGIALAYHDGYIWGTRRNEVWRCRLPGNCWDLPDAGSGPASEAETIAQARILRLSQTVRAHAPCELVITLDNSGGDFTTLASGSLNRGSRVELAVGYRTITNETVPAGYYFIEGRTCRNGPARATITLYCVDGWGLLEHYTVPGPAEFNLATQEFTVYHLIERIIQCIGGTLTYRSRSPLVTGLYPRLEVRAGEKGAGILRRLLSLVPDVLYFNGLNACMIYPQSDDEPVYDIYSPASITSGEVRHHMWYGSWGEGGRPRNRVMVAGRDDDGNDIIAAAEDEADIDMVGERLDIIMQPLLATFEDVQNMACTALEKTRLAYSRSYAVLPPHCGVELWDVIACHDPLNEPQESHWRVNGYSLLYDARDGVFRQRLELGEL